MAAFENWLDPSSYPTANSFKQCERLEGDPLHTNKAWAWQFLRRSGGYRSDYDNKKSRGAKYFTQKYGLTFPLPYSLSDPEYIPFHQTLGLGEVTSAERPIKTIDLSKGKVGLVFDLNLPLKFQLALAEIQLQDLQEQHIAPSSRPKRKRITEFVRYLRIIDAKDKGVTNRDISTQFIKEGLYSVTPKGSDTYYQGQQTVERDWHTARKLMGGGYFSLAYSLTD
jgi:hypothetical protein